MSKQNSVSRTVLLAGVVKANYYVVNLKPDQVPVIREVRSKYFSAEHPPSGTLVGVTALVREDYIIEIDVVTAVK